MNDPTSALRAKAEDQLAALRRQQQGIAQKIAQFEGFLAILDQMGSPNAAVPPRPTGESQPDDRSFPAKLAAVLREVGEPMRPVDVALRMEKSGYSHQGAIPLKVIVSTELARQSKKRAHGIRKVGRGQYTAA